MTKFLKKIFIAILISVTVFNSALFAYDDVPHTSPYFYAIEYLRRNDVFSSSIKLFKPDTLITKAEFIKYLVILNSRDFQPKQNVKLPFDDTRDSAWYAPYFYEAIRLGILSDREQKIDPYRKLSVLEALELLFHSRNIPIPRIYVGPIPYTDVEKNKRSQAMVMRAIELGVVQPDRSDYFGLYKRVSRAKAAHMIYRMDLVDLRDSKYTDQATQEFDTNLQKIVNAWGLVNSNFIGRNEVDSKDLSDSAIKAMVDALEDPYSVYMNQEQNQAFSDEMDGEIEGIGAFVAINEEGDITIVAPIKDSPAFHAGVQSGDVIRKVDDFDTTGATLYDTVSRIKGPKGTTVKLTLERDGKTVVIEVTRDVISIDSLEYEVIGNGKIMHIKLLNFNENAAKDFQEVVEIISNNGAIKGVILDLRDNPGGLLDVAIGILNFVLPNNSIAVQIKYNYFNFTQYTTGEGELQDYPMVVLVNKGSASASEILAGAIQEHEIAKVIGETTFGKGTVQELNYFGDNSSLKLTVAEWMTPEFNSIQENGITPDIEVKQDESADDKQLSRAIQELNRMMR